MDTFFRTYITLHYSNYILSNCQNSKNKDNRNRQSIHQCTLRHQTAWKLKLFFKIHVYKKLIFRNEIIMHKKVQIHSKTCVLLENKKSFYLQAKHKISFVSLFFVSALTQLSFMNDDVAILLSRAICYLDINFQFLSENIALEKSIIKQI